MKNDVSHSVPAPAAGLGSRTRVLAGGALVGLLLVMAASNALAMQATSTAGALTTTITKTAIHPAKHSARFTFVVTGGSPTAAVAFRCGLDHHGYMVGPPRPCSSPKGFGSLQPGVYTFSVYAIDTTGDRSNTASHDFTIS